MNSAVLDFFGPEPVHVPFGTEHKHIFSVFLTFFFSFNVIL